MQVTAFVERTKEKSIVELPAKATVHDLLLKLSLNPVTVLVTRQGNVMIETQPLQDKDEVKILSVVSGG